MDDFPEILEVGGLRLRPVARHDMPEVARQLGDPAVSQWLAAVASPFGETEAEEFYRHSQEPAARIRLLEVDGGPAGCVSLGAGLWYWLEPSHWGQGLMRQALEVSLAAYFAAPAAPLVATCRQDNAASIGLLARLGFSQMATPRRMFFQSTRSAQPCRDYAMTSEQWHFLNPPILSAGAARLRPARQKDAALLARILPRPEQPSAAVWPQAGGEFLHRFLETHRHRGQHLGLFVVEDGDGRAVGVALSGHSDGDAEMLFLSYDDARRHKQAVADALRTA